MKKFRVFLQLFGAVALAFLALYGLFALAGSAGGTLAATGLANITGTSDIPLTMNYQGFLRDPSGDLATGSYTITARIYDQATEGSELYVTTIPNVNVRDGLFNIVLGDDPAIPWEAFSDAPRYIGIDLNDGAGELIPRQRLHAVPWALTAAALVDNATVNGLTAEGALTVNGDVTVNKSTQLSDLIISDNADITGNLNIGGDITLSSTLVLSRNIAYQTQGGLLSGFRLLYLDDFESGANGWEVSNTTADISTLNGISMLGGYKISNAGEVMCNSYELPDDITEVVVRANYYMIDEWDLADDNAIGWAGDGSFVDKGNCDITISNTPGYWEETENDSSRWPDFFLLGSISYRDVVRTVDIRTQHKPNDPLIVVFEAIGLSTLEWYGIDNVEIWGR